VSEGNKAVVRRFIDGLNSGDVAVLSEVRSPDIVWHGGVLGEARGVDDLLAKLSWVHETFPDLHATIEELVAEGDLVVARSTVTGTHSGPLLGVAGTGTRATWTAVAVYRVVGGRIVEQWLSEDWADVLVQVGALPQAD
jgi:predicted ester cyclase